jgi:tetratricopeptide (TPR) repeat protein
MKRQPDAARWLSIAMEEAPGWAAPHAVAARLLLAEGLTDQALVEIREAEQRRASSARRILCRLLKSSPNLETVERGVPSAEQRVDYLDRLATCGGLAPDLRAEIDAAILAVEPTRRGAVLRHSRRLRREKRPEEAIAILDRALEVDPGDENLWVALIRTQLAADDSEQARRALERAESNGIDDRALLEAQARVEAALGDADAMRTAVTRLRGRARGDASLIAKSLILEGELEASLGNTDDALAAYATADVADPDTPALQYAAALALRSGRPTQARRTYRTLCRRKPDGPACAQEARLSKEPSPAPPERPMP